MSEIQNIKSKGFAQTTILIVTIVGVLVVGFGGYFEIKQYQNYQTEKIQKEKIAQEKEREAQAFAEAQQKSLEQAKLEIEKLKEQSIESKKQQESLEKKIQGKQKVQPQNLSISASELTPYLSGIVELMCNNGVGGSGSLYPSGFVLTNFHVIENQRWCTVQKTEANNIGSEMYYIKTSDAKAWNNETDVAVVKINYITNTSCVDEAGNPVVCPKITPIENLNYKIFNLPLCQIEIPLGSPVAIVGYPASSRTQFDVGGIQGSQKTRIVTTGIISGYKTTGAGNPLWETFLYPDYFISAKIDSGNSGGIAFSKNENGLCVLGIPTWLTVGNYETQGLVQNIHNILYKQ